MEGIGRLQQTRISCQLFSLSQPSSRGLLLCKPNKLFPSIIVYTKYTYVLIIFTEGMIIKLSTNPLAFNATKTCEIPTFHLRGKVVIIFRDKNLLT